MHWTDHYRKAIVFSYDDGNEQDIPLLELFRKYGVKGTFHVNTGLDAANGTWCYANKLWVHRLDLATYSSVYAGHEVAVHGKLHRNLTELTKSECEEEIGADITAITRIFREKPVGMSYAYGAYHAGILKTAAMLGMQYGRSVISTHHFDLPKNPLEFHPTCHHDDPVLWELADRFLAQSPKTPQVFSIWGHSYELEGKGHWEQMERFLDKVSGKQDIFYGTCREVLVGEAHES